MKKVERFKRVGLACGLITLVFGIQGCAFKAEGVSFGSFEYGVDPILDLKEKQGKAAIEGNSREEFFYQPGDEIRPIFVGTSSHFRKFEENEAEEFYPQYSEFAQRINPDKAPSISLGDFVEMFSGWTMLKYFSVPLVGGLYEDALVPKALAGLIKFPSATTTALVQATGDLIAGQVNADGFLVIERLLCKEKEDFKACKQEYEKGIFDAATGRELKQSLELKESGRQIDVNSLKVLRETE
jgi:hypothetical protein